MAFAYSSTYGSMTSTDPHHVVSVLESTIRSYSERNSELERTVTDLKNQIHVLKDTAVNDSRKINQLQESCKQLHYEKHNLANETSTLKVAVDSRIYEIETLKKEHALAMEAKSKEIDSKIIEFAISSKYKSLEESNITLVEQNKTPEESSNTLRALVNSLSAQLREKTTIIDQLTSKNASLSRECDDIKAYGEKLFDDIFQTVKAIMVIHPDLPKENDRLLTANMRLDKENDELTKSKTELEQMVKDLTTKNADLTYRVTGLDAKIADLVESNTKLAKEKETLECEVAKHVCAYIQLTSTNSFYIQENKNLVNQVNMLSKRCLDTDEEKSELEEELNGMWRSYKELSVDRVQMRNELDKYRTRAGPDGTYLALEAKLQRYIQRFGDIDKMTFIG